MFRNRRLKKVKEMKRIHYEAVKGNIDEYMAGLYNGLELAIAIMENREPALITSNVREEPEVIEREEEQEGRTIASGIRRNKTFV